MRGLGFLDTEVLYPAKIQENNRSRSTKSAYLVGL